MTKEDPAGFDGRQNGAYMKLPCYILSDKQDLRWCSPDINKEGLELKNFLQPAVGDVL